jgi:hypothetical protein
MHNKYRGEISANLDGRDYRLCLSLGALAELEAAFGASDMVALAARFENGRLSAHDAIRIIGAGLRGAGNDIANEAVAEMRTPDAAAGYMAIVVELLQATFGGDANEEKLTVGENGALREEGRPAPFPGTT